MAKSFTIAFNGSPADQILHPRIEAQKAGATFQGEDDSGNFQGKGIVGEYRIEGGPVTITITSKPLPQFVGNDPSKIELTNKYITQFPFRMSQQKRS